jgi:heme/copper-type cytochrome/quinol oxidase subunit 4
MEPDNFPTAPIRRMPPGPLQAFPLAQSVARIQNRRLLLVAILAVLLALVGLLVFLLLNNHNPHTTQISLTLFCQAEHLH